MAAALPRTSPSNHPRLTADDEAKRIVRELRELPARREQADHDELRLIERARALGWAWEDVAAAYPPSPQTGRKWSLEGVRRRWLILDARLRDDENGGHP